MSGPAGSAIHVAVALLPSRLRNRYREQWLGELRDAPEFDIKASEIALAALTFAVTLERPLLPTPKSPTTHHIAQRSRVAVALALSAALVALIHYPSARLAHLAADDGALASTLTTVGSALLLLYTVLASMLSLAVAFGTAGVSRATRVTVGVLSLASVLPLATNSIDAFAWSGNGNALLTPGTLTYLGCLLLIGFASVYLWRARLPHTSRVRPFWRSRAFFASAIGGLLLALASMLGFAHASAAWLTRTPMPFMNGEAITDSNRAVASDPVLYADWLSFKTQEEQTVEVMMGSWLAIALMLAVVVVLSGVSARASVKSSAVLGLTAFSKTLALFGALVSFLTLIAPTAVVAAPGELLTLLGQCGLILVLLRAAKPTTAYAGSALQAAPLQSAA